MLEACELRFAYAGRPPLFVEFSWSVAAGETWAVLGPSGCGKSTLLMLAAGLLRPQQGDVRVAGATNRDLPALVADGKFRADLYYRVSVFVIPLPPLRERREDIPLLAGEFLRTLDPSGQTRLSPESAALLATLDYPGNVRQLRNLIERLTIVCAGRRVEPADIAELSPLTGLPGSASVSLAERVAAYERELIRQALREAGGNIAAAARELKVDRANLSRRIKDLGLK